MVLAYHTIFSTYGFWLPNDPRGSWSDFVRSWELVRFGKATKVETTRSVANVSHDHDLRQRAKEALRYPPVVFTGRQALSVGKAFAQAAAESRYVIHACTIMPEHVHMVIARHEHPIERIVGHLKARATQQLGADGLHPLHAFARGDAAPPSPWGRRGWHVYLDDTEGINRAVRYVESNPEKEGKPPQKWSFVTPWGA